MCPVRVPTSGVICNDSFLGLFGVGVYTWGSKILMGIEDRLRQSTKTRHRIECTTIE